MGERARLAADFEQAVAEFARTIEESDDKWAARVVPRLDNRRVAQHVSSFRWRWSSSRLPLRAGDARLQLGRHQHQERRPRREEQRRQQVRRPQRTRRGQYSTAAYITD
jgi:hypothetical protein